MCKCRNYLFIFFDFCSCQVLSKAEENSDIFWLKRYAKNKKSGARYKKSQGTSSCWTHVKFSSSKVRRKKLCIDETSSNSQLLTIGEKNCK
jgi:hypothetical protein